MQTKTYSTTPLDWFNFTAQNYNSNALIQYIIVFDKPLDFEILKKAVNNCIIADPLLGCVYSTMDSCPEWVAVNVETAGVCRHVTTDRIVSEIDRFLAERIDVGKEAPFKIALIESIESILVIKVHHALCDGIASLQFVRLLAEMYGKLQDHADYKMKLGIPRRGLESFFNFFHVEDKKTRFNPSLLNMISTWGTPSGSIDNNPTFAYQTRRFSPQQLRNLKHFAAENNSTINAAITAAYHQTLIQILNPSDEMKEIQFTADLRRYSNSREQNTLCNLSTILNIELPTFGLFSDIACKAKLAIDSALEPENIIQSVLACDLLETVGYHASVKFYADEWNKVKSSGLSTPMISNIGRLDKEIIAFGEIVPRDVQFIPPAFVGPSFMLAASTFDDVLSLTSSYYRPSTSDDFVTSLLGEMSKLIESLSR